MTTRFIEIDAIAERLWFRVEVELALRRVAWWRRLLGN